MHQCKMLSCKVLFQVVSRVTHNFLMKLHGSQKPIPTPIKLELSIEIDSTNQNPSINQLWSINMVDCQELITEATLLFMIRLMVLIHLDLGMQKLTTSQLIKQQKPH